MNEHNILIHCDVCDAGIVDFEGDLYHVTSILDGELDPHTHLCHRCFSKHIHSVPVLNSQEEDRLQQPSNFPNWYDNIPPRGINCWVWDFNPGNKSIATVIEYHTYRTHPFLDTTGYHWKFANPITTEDLKGLLSRQ